MFTYEEVAKGCGLDAATAARFCHYMRTRWAVEESTQCQVGYAQEWANRFKNKVEFAASDSEGQEILRSMNEL